ncbi:protein FAM161A-like [Watersipora subatra]|uniref:protein FAM161A-like n=1 Tax=Watersipora subatra TaxID=2589382 RepID=UPI00355C824D
MATDFHKASVITNSSVKVPIEPINGLPHTLHERVRSQPVWEQCDEDDEYAYSSPMNGDGASHVKHSYTLSPRDPKIESLAEDLDMLNDEQFYERLQELKADHQKTLSMCAQAYKTKVAEMSGTADRVRDMSKPPLPPSVSTRQAWQTERNINNHSVFRRTTDSSANEDSDEDSRMHSHVNTPLTERNSSRLDGLSDSMERIKGMWKDFNLDEYAPSRAQRELTASASGSYSSNKENNSWGPHASTGKVGDTWSPVITIPKPFRMMLREEKKQKTKTKAQEELEQKRLEERKAEEAELSKKFKATPAPAHIYMPLYDDITEQQETKRRLNHQYREELLRSVEKPFKFYQREEAKRRQKVNKEIYEGKSKSRKKETFKAKPIPRVLEEDISEKLAVEEEYRKIRNRMRAEELLRESRLPPSMDAREKTKELNRIKQLARELRGFGLSSEPSFRPKITGDAPDFEELHRRNAQRLAEIRAEKEGTVMKPFHLRTSRILSNKEKIIDDIVQDEQQLPEKRWPYKNSRVKPSNIGKLSASVTSADRMPSMGTQSVELRRSHTKKKMTEEMQKELARLEYERKRRQKAKKLKKEVIEKAAGNDIQYGLIDQSSEKTRRYREENRIRAEEYRRSLREMQDRISDRPLLFEKTTQKIARQRAERKYEETLNRAGVSRDAMDRRGGTSPERGNLSDDDGPYRGFTRKTDFSSGGVSPSSPKSYRSAKGGSPTHTYTNDDGDSYSNTFTKEETGLSDGDMSEVESLPDRELELAD